EKTLFGRPLAPLFLELGLAFVGLGLAYSALRLAAPSVERAGQALTVGIMVSSAGLMLVLGLGLDAFCSAIRNRPSLWGTLAALRSSKEA
ncbi:MAG TPA: hypothetical protein VK786_02570, partial [bacterium]|nr:hypothetical protein [bacterium]